MKKLIYGLTISMTIIVASIGIMYANKSQSKAASVSVVKNIWKSLFTEYTSIKTTISYEGDRDTAQGIAVVDNVIYSAKLHTDGTTTLIKTVKDNGKVKHIMPVKNLNLGHANDITYYNGYLFIAGLNNKFYRVKDEGMNSKGYEKYSVKTYICKDVPNTPVVNKYSVATINITHYTGKYFIFCSSIKKNGLMTFNVGYFNNNNNEFIITKTFVAQAKAFRTVQSLTYKNGYLYQTTSDNENTGYMNKISEYYIGSNYNNLQAMYSLSHYGTFDDWKNEEKFEIEGIDFDNQGKLYISVNVAGRRDYIYVSKNKIEM